MRNAPIDSLATVDSQDMKVVDLSGYSFTGKSAVYDLLTEFDGYQGGGKEFEFELIRMPGGILDLESALVKQWSPVRSSEAVRRFRKIVRNLGGSRSISSRFFRLGSHYDYYFPGFTERAEAYINSLVQSSWEADWPFAFFEYSPAGIFGTKLLGLTDRKNQFRSRIFLSKLSSSDFSEVTQEFLMGLLYSSCENGARSVVLNNCLEPFSPEVGLKFLRNAKSIVVDRDPRDVYLSAMDYCGTASAGVGKAVLGNDVEDFIRRFRIYRSEVVEANSSVLRLKFEDLVLNYDESLTSILRFLGEHESVHKSRKKSFDPERSVRNIGQWARADKSRFAAIDQIADELSEFCVDS